MFVLVFWKPAADTHHLRLSEKPAGLAAGIAHRIGFPALTAAFRFAATASAMLRISAWCIRFILCSAGVTTRSFVDGAADFTGAVGVFECIIESFPYLSMV